MANRVRFNTKKRAKGVGGAVSFHRAIQAFHTYSAGSKVTVHPEPRSLFTPPALKELYTHARHIFAPLC